MNWKNWMLVGMMFLSLIGCDKNSAEQGKELFHSGDFQKSIEAFDLYLVDHPQDHQSFYNRGRAYEELKQYDKAIESLRAASKLAPKEVVYWMSMGACNFKMKKYEHTISNMDAILELNEHNTDALVLKARACAYSSQVIKAMKILDLAIRYDAKCGDAYMQRGLIRAKARDIHTCEDLKKARSLRAKGAEALVKKYCN